jgi:RES domain-containing protein
MLTKALPSPPSEPFNGLAYKLVRDVHANNPLSTVGSQKQSGRYHVKGAYPVIYLGLTPLTCVREITYHLSDYDADLPLISTVGKYYSLCEYHVTFRHVVNLCKADVRDALNINLEILIGDSYDDTQSIGQHLYCSKLSQAFLVPSARDSTGQCLNVFMSKLKRHQKNLVVLSLEPSYWPRKTPV